MTTVLSYIPWCVTNDIHFTKFSGVITSFQGFPYSAKKL